MAVSTIKKRGFGERETITFPFTPPSDGIIMVYMGPTSASGGVATISYDAYTGLTMSSANSTGQGSSMPVKAGEQVYISQFVNCNLYAWFTPIV